MNASELYEQRLTRFDDVLSRKLPDRVPIIPNMNTWMYHYAGISVKKAFSEDAGLQFEAAKHLTDNMPIDGLMSTSNTVPLKLAEKVGEGIYTCSDNGVQIKGSGGHLMEPEEYKLLAENPMKFFANVLIPRKFDLFKNASLEKKVDVIKQAFADNVEFMKYNRSANVRIEGELGLPIIIRGTNFLSPDVVLDYLRDFVGISLDVRRHSDELLAACMSLYDYILEMFHDTATPPDRKIIFSPLHLPTYLRPKDFAKLYLPFMKRYLEEMSVKQGYSVYFFMENDWMPYLDLLQELPDNAKFVGLFEKGNLKEMKAKLGKKMVIMGGMPVSLLLFGSKEEVIEKTKECLDTLAPDGGYIFSTDKTMMTLNDGKPENMIAACEYVEVHGKY
ncbi:MAG: uroporphyrinogen decarboxylase family protein [Eubacteriales bacterium]|nr:uroporphyrinogen decarboxylase family protein [Eubacteriales bacterium]